MKMTKTSYEKILKAFDANKKSIFVNARTEKTEQDIYAIVIVPLQIGVVFNLCDNYRRFLLVIVPLQIGVVFNTIV